MVRKKKVNKKRELDKNMKNLSAIYSPRGLLVILAGVLVVVALAWVGNQASVGDELSTRVSRTRTGANLLSATATPAPSNLIKKSATIIGVSTVRTTKGTLLERVNEAKAEAQKVANAMLRNGTICDRPVALMLRELNTVWCRDGFEPVSYDLTGVPERGTTELPPAPGEPTPTVPVMAPKIRCPRARNLTLGNIPGSRLQNEVIVFCAVACKFTRPECQRVES